MACIRICSKRFTGELPLQDIVDRQLTRQNPDSGCKFIDVSANAALAGMHLLSASSPPTDRPWSLKFGSSLSLCLMRCQLRTMAMQTCRELRPTC